jgi:hypothetical protein
VTIRVGQVEEPLAPQRILRRNRHALSLAGRVSVCHRVAVLPPSSRGLTRDLRSPLGAYSFGSGLPAVPAERDGSGVLALILGRRHVIGDLSGRNPREVDSVADDVARAALALRASGHDLVEVGLEYFFQAQRVDV